MPRPTISMKLLTQLSDMINNPDCSIDSIVDVIVNSNSNWSREQATTFLANLLVQLNA